MAVLSPRADLFADIVEPVQKSLTDLHDRTLAFLGNGRPAAEDVLDVVATLLKETYRVHAVRLAKRDHGIRDNDALPPAVFDDLAARVDGVVCALAS
jgi:hypothetical protein